MMAFLRPEALWLFPLAGLPLVLHFWGKVRARPTPFTAIELLREAAQTRISTEKIRRWILLAVRTLLFASLILFLAKPGFRGALGSNKIRGVILLDASYSLNASQSGETAFDRARGMARALVQSKHTGDRWGLVIFSDRVEKSISPDEDPKILLQAIESARSTYRGTSYAVGFAEGEKQLKGNGTVVLLSDLAAHGLSNEPFSQEKRLNSVVAVEVVSRRTNAAITGIRPGGVGESLRAEILGWGETPIRTWSLKREGRWDARGQVRWEAGRGGAVFSPGPGVAELNLSPDSLPTDDRWFFVSHAQKPFSVCLVNGAPSLSPVGDETYFIRPVLDGLSSAGIKVRDSSLGDLSPTTLSETQVMILLNPPPLPPATVDQLTEFVEAGGGLWVTAGDRGGLPSLGGVLPLHQLTSKEMDEGLEWSGSDVLLDLKGLLWDRVHVDRAWAGTPRSGAQVLVRTGRTKKPLLTVSSHGRGRVALWGSTVDRDWTNLPAKPAFPVLMGRLLLWLAGNQGQDNPSAYFVGDVIGRGGEENRPLHVLRPDGRVERMDWSGGQWTYQKTDVPGFYAIQGAQEEKVAVNVRSEKEGDLTRMNPEMFKAQLGDVPFRWIPADKARTEEIMSALQGRDLTSLVGWALFVLLFLETVLLFPRRKKKI